MVDLTMFLFARFYVNGSFNEGTLFSYHSQLSIYERIDAMNKIVSLKNNVSDVNSIEFLINKLYQEKILNDSSENFEFNKIINFSDKSTIFDKRNYLILRFFLDYKLNEEIIRTLKWSYIDFKKRTLSLPNSTAIIALDTLFLEQLRDFYGSKCKDNDLIFLTKQHKQLKPKYISKTIYKKYYKKHEKILNEKRKNNVRKSKGNTKC